ncbi:probable E3 ubiquitin-protein ligase RHG1A [Vicia villosa]|uniref:probable E3 ubiquitin-protein ligase RHG1A n=1 Tax=Vicia villosa TaxID=3911 RepID=UPI00273C7EB4|nr:probable E3 ubiquitin-protein ligase RHG1A [Vicia villosa]
MGHQFRLTNWNEDESPTRDVRDPRYLMASYSLPSLAFNNHTRSFGTNHQVVLDNIMQNNPLHSYITNIQATTDNHYHSTMVIPTPININNYNDNQTSPSSNSSPPRLFGSSLTLGPTSRSRLPNFVRGESSNQGSQVGGTSRRHTNLPPHTFQQESVNNNNFMSFEVGSSPSSQSLGRGFSGYNHNNNNYNNNNNLDLFDSIHEGIDEIFVHSTINAQQHVRHLPEDHVSQFVTPSIVHVRSNSSVPRQPQPPSDPSTISYRVNPSPPPHGPMFNTAEEFDNHMVTGTTLSRSGNLRRYNNHILTLTSPELMNERNRLRDEVLSTLQHLQNGRSVRIEDLLILDYSIVLNVLDSQERIDMLHSIDDWPYEEDYAEGDITGRLDCRHIYHFECIKQWLLQKNICPICKHTALRVNEDVDERD